MEIFFIIPSLLILKSLENDDKNICSHFYPDMYDKTNKQGETFSAAQSMYENGRKTMGNDYDYYNLVEKSLCDVDLNEAEIKMADELSIPGIIKEIKGLAMCLSRFKPADWNKFLDVVIKWINI